MGCCGNIVTGAVGLAKAAVGADAAPPEVVQQRRDLCRECPHASRNPERAHLPSKGLTTLSTCALCGCFIAAKTKIASESCPADPPRWDNITSPARLAGDPASPQSVPTAALVGLAVDAPDPESRAAC